MKKFVEQVIKLNATGKPKNQNSKRYDLTLSIFNKWIRQHKESGSFEEKNNRTPE